MTAPTTPWLCPRDETCPGNRHDDWQGMRRGCRSGAARDSYHRYRKRLRLGIAQPRQVSALGSRRRLQALVAIGWSYNAIADEIGWKPTWAAEFTRGVASADWCTSETAERVSRLFERLCMTPGGRSPEARKRALNLAARNGWPPPLAWTNIDDPDEEPTIGTPVDDEPDEHLPLAAIACRLRFADLTRADAEHVIASLRGAGRDNADIADLLRCEPNDVVLVWQRIRLRKTRAAKAAA